MEIHIDIAKKVARVIGTPIIVCGNSGYTVRFTYDDEWLDKAVLTARFVWVHNGETHFKEVPFTGSTVAVPILEDVTVVQVGVYAGDLQTTTPARVPCVRSILCGGGKAHADPAEDVYNQLIQLIEDSAIHTPTTLAIEERSTGKPFTFWMNTTEALAGIAPEDIVPNCLYLLTDDPLLDEIEAAFEASNARVDALTKRVENIEGAGGGGDNSERINLKVGETLEIPYTDRAPTYECPDCLEMTYEDSTYLEFTAVAEGSGTLTLSNSDGVLAVYEVTVTVASGGQPAALPTVTEADNGKIMEVVNGKWTAVAPKTETLTFTYEDGSKRTVEVCVK